MAPIVEVINISTREGRIRGVIMYFSFCHLVAPSISEASITDSEIALSPARNIITSYPIPFHMDTIATENMAILGSPSQSTVGSLNISRI